MSHPREEASDNIHPTRVRVDSEDAFRSLFDEYYAALVSFAERYLRDVAIAEEVVNDVFVRLWEIRSTWAPTTSVRAYLFGAVRNRALSALRQRRGIERERSLDHQSVTSLTAPQTAPDLELEQLEVERQIWDAVEELSEQERMILRLRWREGLQWDEISTVLEISVAAAQMKHTRSLRVLRNKLRRHFS